jgi:peptidoglycan/xylan/chitin deacetylase (PgdA/CDA1 family)
VKRRIINKIRNLFAHNAVVLMYHRIAEPESDVWGITVSPARFEDHLMVLKKTGKVVPLEQLADAVNAKSLPKNRIAITFDDGYLDNFKAAKPLLEKYGIPATFFIASGNVDSENEFWWDELERLILFTDHLPALFSMTINEHSIIFDLKDESFLSEKIRQKHRSWKAGSAEPPTLRAGLFYRVWEQLRCLPHTAQQHHLQLVKNWAGSSLPARPDYRTMSVNELKQMAANNLFTFGAHTVTHPALADHNAQFQENELTENRRSLQEITGQDINMLAYPYGVYNKETLQVASDLGFKAAFTTEEKTIKSNSSIYRLGRFQVMNLTETAFTNQLKYWREG